MSYLGRQLNLPASTVQLTAAKALTAGNAVLIASDGKATVPGASLGSETVVADVGSSLNTSVFDSGDNKVIVAYQDSGNSDYGTAAVGTVSGTGISFGTPVVFQSAATQSQIALTYDTSNSKVVVAYKHHDGSVAKASVGTVSGTAISFGTATNFESGGVADAIAATFDSNSNKVVIAYRDNSNSNYGTAIVGTVSGTSISFGSATVFESATVTVVAATFDSSNNKVVIAYKDGGNSLYGTAIVGTVSSTSISFGSAQVFNSASTNAIAASFDTTNNKVLIGYADGSSSGQAIVGTVSSTSISFGTEADFHDAQTGSTSIAFNPDQGTFQISYRDEITGKGEYVTGTISGTSVSFDTATEFNDSTTAPTIVYDTNSDVPVVFYRDSGNSSRPTARVIDLGTALTSENFIGFAEEDVTANGLAKIQLGGSVNDKQTSLTAGQTYFVQTDGTIGTTADSPSVTAGTAVSATEILVKG